MKIHFMGGTGVGKSVLAAFASTRTGLPLLPSPSRAAITSPQTRDAASRIFIDLDAADGIQRLIWGQMLAGEAGAVASHGGFVSERSLDVLAYTADQSRILWEITRTDGFRDYIASFAGPERMVFFVRPEESVVKKAADGIRDPWLSWECVNRIDGAIQILLEMNNIGYIPVRGNVLRDRYRLVDEVLRRSGIKFTSEPYDKEKGATP